MTAASQAPAYIGRAEHTPGAEAARPWAVRMSGIGKHYRLGERGPLNQNIREDIMNALGRIGRGAKRNPEREAIWALRGIDLEIERGETLGIIGHNGAGKSTLLKILSRITPPTEGSMRYRGRLSSLLEVGTGFHRELTGRENIFLNGAILGMRRSEIREQFDAIVDFAGVERFLDTPVKFYSSGMYVRLAFAVAAHLRTDILVIDEVLAVGDAQFQRKCLGKMGDVVKEGRTVIFVSHNMAAIQSLCRHAIHLESGRILTTGAAPQVVKTYLQSVNEAETTLLDSRLDRGGDGSVKAMELRIENADGGGAIASGSRLKVTIRYRSDEPVRHPKFLVGIYDVTKVGIFLLDSDAAGGLPETLPAEGTIECVTDPINLTSGRCSANLALFKAGAMTDYIQEAAYIDVETEEVPGAGKAPPRDWVLCVIRQRWSAGGGA